MHTDQTATPREITDEAGQIVWRWDARPFGDSQAQNDPDGDGRAFVFNLRAPGQYYDSESGLFYNYHRYYDPELGRYITPDPIGLEGGLNTYAYVSGNPINTYDPLGLAETWWNKVYPPSFNTSPGYQSPKPKYIYKPSRKPARSRRYNPGNTGSGGGSTLGVWGCIGVCASYTEGDYKAKASVEPTVGGGISICSPPPPPEQCDDGIYGGTGIDFPGKAGLGLSVNLKSDGSTCFNIGPHVGFPIAPSANLGDVY